MPTGKRKKKVNKQTHLLLLYKRKHGIIKNLNILVVQGSD